MYFFPRKGGMSTTHWKSFKDKMLLDGDVKKLNVVNGEEVEVFIKKDSLSEKQYENAPTRFFSDEHTAGPHYKFTIGSVELFDEHMKEVGISDDALPVIEYTRRENWFGQLLSWLIPIGIIILLWMFIMRRAFSRMQGGGGGLFNMGQSRAKVLEKTDKVNVSFDSIAGLEEPKEEIIEIVNFLKSPESYEKLGAEIPKGVMLFGPPGTGKTLLAKAVAGEAGVPFFSLSGSEFVEMFVGVGASRMRDLFQKAKEKSPSIIFIDEIDTVGRSRKSTRAFQQNDERENTLNQLLSELDGFNSSTNVVVIAATNQGEVLDPALLRPGRFDRHINLELPSLKEREAIFGVHMKNLELDDKVSQYELAAQTPGFSGADISNICNEAALVAARKNKKKIESNDFREAIDRVIAGLEKKSKIISREEKERIAYHEAGHVTASWFLKHTQPVLKVSIVPRGKSLGASWYTPREQYILTRAQIFDQICTALGGRAAEAIIFGDISSNALDDLESVTKQAYTMVSYYGFSESLPNVSYYDSSGKTQQSLQKPYSEKTAEKIDHEVQKIINRAYKQTKEILEKRKDQLVTLAQELMEHEVVYKEKITKLFEKTESNEKPVNA
ncbi:MAG TPA: ATP-dependent zinc metalloprotease FtsH [Cyclobacteriaceae bacterium]